MPYNVVMPTFRKERKYKKKKKYGSDAAALRKEKEASSLKANSASYKDDIDGA